MRIKAYLPITITVIITLLTLLLSLNFLEEKAALFLTVVVFIIALLNVPSIHFGIVSLLPIILFPLLHIATLKETTANYAHPIIYLFLGGFLIAIAFEKSDLHRRFAMFLLTHAPKTPFAIMLALMASSALISALLSNTTTTLLLLPIALALSEFKMYQTRLVLGIAYGASIGGILTPIGTAPNLLLIGFLQSNQLTSLNFISWMLYMLPLVLVMISIGAYILSRQIKTSALQLKPLTLVKQSAQTKMIIHLILLCIALIANAVAHSFHSPYHIHDAIILLSFGLLLFFKPFKILDFATDRSKIPFEILFLFGAGFSIAFGFQSTGLAEDAANALSSICYLPPFLLIITLAALVTFSTELTSNTALISISLPILYATFEQNALDSELFLLVATICASYAFMLPIATPPNAIAMSSGVVTTKQMVKFGLVFNLLGITLVATSANFFWKYLL